MLSDLINALQIFLKYGDIEYPTHCEHDQLSVAVNPEAVTAADIAELEKLGFITSGDCFISFRFGSC